VHSLSQELLRKHDEVGALQTEITNLKGNLRGSNGKITMLKFQLEKTRQQTVPAEAEPAAPVTMAAPNSAPADRESQATVPQGVPKVTVVGANLGANNSPSKSDWIMHWKKSRPLVRSLSSVLQGQMTAAVPENTTTVTDDSKSGPAEADCLSLAPAQSANEAVAVQEIVSGMGATTLQHRLAVQERFNQRLVIQMKAWVDSQIEMHRQLAEAEVTAGAEATTAASLLIVQAPAAPTPITIKAAETVAAPRREQPVHNPAPKAMTPVQSRGNIEQKLLSGPSSVSRVVTASAPSPPVMVQTTVDTAPQPSTTARHNVSKTPSSLMKYLKTQMKAEESHVLRDHPIAEDVDSEDDIETFDMTIDAGPAAAAQGDDDVSVADEVIVAQLMKSASHTAACKPVHQKLDFSESLQQLNTSHQQPQNVAAEANPEHAFERPRSGSVDSAPSTKSAHRGYLNSSSSMAPSSSAHKTSTQDIMRQLSLSGSASAAPVTNQQSMESPPKSRPTARKQNEFFVPATPNTVRNAWTHWRSAIDDTRDHQNKSNLDHSYAGSNNNNANTSAISCGRQQMPTIYEEDQVSVDSSMYSRSTQPQHHHQYASNLSTSRVSSAASTFSHHHHSNHHRHQEQSLGSHLQSQGGSHSSSNSNFGSVNELSPASFKQHVGRWKMSNSAVQDNIARVRDTLQVSFIRVPVLVSKDDCLFFRG
jgi:hypothetical protein